MTAHDTHSPDSPGRRTDTTPCTPVAGVSRDTTGVTIWRITADTVGDSAATGTSDPGDSPLTSRLARHLIAIYSDVHDTVIDVDADSTLQPAAEAAGRAYLTTTDTTAPGPHAHQRGPATLIVLRWPRPDTAKAKAAATSLLSRCRQRLTHDGSTIVVVVTATQPGADGTSPRQHVQTLLPAAHTAGLRHLHDIVAVDAVDGRDTFTYATDEDIASAATRQDATTILVILTQPGRRP